MSLSDKQKSVVVELDNLAELAVAQTPHELESLVKMASIVSFRPVLAAGGVTLLEPLSSEEWLSFCSQLHGRYNNIAAAGTDIPTVIIAKMFEECNIICGGIHELEYEGIKQGIEHVGNYPDIAVLSKHSRDTSIESVVIPVQIKKFHDINRAIHQAMGYLATKLRNCIDLYGFGQRLHGFCIGTDGLALSIGHITIDNDELEVFSTGAGRIPFWPNGVISADPTTFPT